jgi:hypothetical protein
MNFRKRKRFTGHWTRIGFGLVGKGFAAHFFIGPEQPDRAALATRERPAGTGAALARARQRSVSAAQRGCALRGVVALAVRRVVVHVMGSSDPARGDVERGSADG